MNAIAADYHMLQRYREVCECHPDSVLIPVFYPETGCHPFDAFTEGTKAHVAIHRGSCVFVTWVPSPQVQWLFDLYAS